MEATAGVAGTAASRGSSLPLTSSSSASRKEWRVVSDHQSVRNSGDEELERSKFSQSDERTIYEVQQGSGEPLDVDFCSITIEGTSDSEILQRRAQNIARQREELLHLEIELRAQILARSEIVEMQNSFDSQIKEHVNAASTLQEQLHEREQRVRELERKMEEKDRELHAVKLDNEAAWAKQNLLREQNKELATFRRERDHSEAERAQHSKQIHDLQEHIQDKERQLIELQEQNRVAQETIMYKEEQLREAQAWIARIRDVDVLQSTTNQTLQAELRERTEQYNQLWVACQRQFAEMERLHIHTIQQLQYELAEARGRGGSNNGESHLSHTNSQRNLSQFGQENGNHFDINGSNASGGEIVVPPTESSDNVQPFALPGNTSNQDDRVAGVPVAPPSLLGMPTYLPPGQMAPLPPIVVHPQGAPQTVASHVPPYVGHFHSVPPTSVIHQWQNQQVVQEPSQIPLSQTDQNLIRPEVTFNYGMSVNGQSLNSEALNHRNRGEESIISSAKEVQPQSVDQGHVVASQPENMQQISSHFQDALVLNSLKQTSQNKERNVLNSSNQRPEDQVSIAVQASSVSNSPADIQHGINHGQSEAASSNAGGITEIYASTGHTENSTGGNQLQSALLDERSLLACIVRTIPASGRVKISTTLPNRLGKMLAPLHWHDYRKKYGKLDEFVASHPELFMIEGDHIQLREGAQKMVAATAAVAKVAAAAAASSIPSPYSPTVAVTPMAQSHRLKRIPSVDSQSIRADKAFIKEYAAVSPSRNDLVMPSQQMNGVNYNGAGGLLNVKILSKSKDSSEMSDAENRSAQSSGYIGVENGSDLDTRMTSSKSFASVNGRLGTNLVARQQNRTSGTIYNTRK